MIHVENGSGRVVGDSYIGPAKFAAGRETRSTQYAPAGRAAHPQFRPPQPEGGDALPLRRRDDRGDRRPGEWSTGSSTRGSKRPDGDAADSHRRSVRLLRLALARGAGGNRSGDRRGRGRLRAGPDRPRQVDPPPPRPPPRAPPPPPRPPPPPPT